jgi:hypothetical protein
LPVGKSKGQPIGCPFVEKIDELSDSFFQDLQVIEDFLKPSPESIFHS